MSSQPQRLPAERVLVVDDEKNIRLTLRQALEEQGLEVAIVSSGEAALEQLRAGEAFALMLLDLKMPGLGGMEVLQRTQELRPGLPVVVFTAHGSAENATEAMKLGAADFIEKPFTPPEIRALVDEVRARRSGNAESGNAEEAPSQPPLHNRTYRAFVFLSDPATEAALVRLAAASAHSYARGEVLAVSAEPPQSNAAPRIDLAAVKGRARDLGVAVRVRTAAGTGPHDVLPNATREEQPSHVLLEWTGTPREARSLDTLAQQIADEVGCEVTLVRPGDRPARRIAALVSDEPYALIAVRRALEFAKSAGVASLTLLSVQPLTEDAEERPMKDGLTLIHKVAREAGLPEGKYYPQVTLAENVQGALPRVANDFDTICLSAAHASALAPVLFGADEAGSEHIPGTVAVVRGPDHAPRTVMASLVERLTGRA